MTDQKPTDAQYVAAARARYEREGEIEIDDSPQVSRGDDPGAYVQAWVWVYDSEVERRPSESASADDALLPGEWPNCADCHDVRADCGCGDFDGNIAERNARRSDVTDSDEPPRCVCGHFLTGDVLCRECGRAQPRRSDVTDAGRSRDVNKGGE